MAKKKAKKKTTAASNLFSLIAVHRELKKARMRLAKQPKTAAAILLAQDLRNASNLLACDQTMSPNIA